jgi:hypothetical protein
MAGSTNSSTITQTITLGSATYTSPLTVTGSGVIERSSSITTTIDFVFCNELYDGFGNHAGAHAWFERLRAAFGAERAHLKEIQ